MKGNLADWVPRKWTREEWKLYYRELRRTGGGILNEEPRVVYKYWQDGKRLSFKNMPAGQRLCETVRAEYGMKGELIMHVRIYPYPGIRLVVNND